MCVDATDPEGGTERVEFHISNTAGVSATAPSGEVPSGYSTYNQELDKRNSLYWSKLAMQQAPGQLSSAVITHWLMGNEMAYAPHALSRRIPHSIKWPLEHRIWYNYLVSPSGIENHFGILDSSASVNTRCLAATAGPRDGEVRGPFVRRSGIPRYAGEVSPRNSGE